MGRLTKRLPARQTVALVGDGQVERFYFSDVRDTDRPAMLSIFPDYPRKIGNYKGVLEQAASYVGNYDHVFALIDMDKIIHDKQHSTYRKDKSAAETAGVIVLENNPCFEIWLLLHFIHSGKLFTNCHEGCEQLRIKGRIPNYDKSEKFLKNAKLYQTYKTQLVEQAIPNAKRLENSQPYQDVLYPRAETFRFFEWYFMNLTVKNMY